ncbi:MAG: DpnD/PcfM family protein [Neisseria sp.]|nr:DpnD/PcfM family protein [Neisseria sp.]
MASFQIEIQETLSRVITVESESPAQALQQARQLYRQEEIILDWHDWSDTQIQICHSSE